jgi:solute carrier family 25 2-oxodicarboxylate transporter 21
MSGTIIFRTGVIGTAVGFFATCFNAPFDVVKSRFQSQLPGEKKYNSVSSALVSIAR